MWIRSQDKLELSEVKSISSNKIDDGWVIFVNERWYGMYESQERCTQVLDEIQCLIINSWGYCTVGDGDIVTEGAAFYQMPKE